MDIALLILGFVLMLVGILGSFLPVLPGPPISWVGLLLLYLTEAVPDNWWILGGTLILALGVTVLDYVIPAAGTKKFGGSKAGMWGTVIGLLIGLFLPIPGGFIFGAFLGAFIGELSNNVDLKRSLKAAFGDFLCFLTGTFLMFLYAGWFGYVMITHISELFSL